MSTYFYTDNNGAKYSFGKSQGADNINAGWHLTDRKASILVTLTVTTGSAYTQNYVVGGKLSFLNAVRGSECLGAIIRGALLIDSSGAQHGTYDLVFFEQDPTTGGSTVNNNAAYALNATDRAAVIGVCPLNGAWTDDANGSVQQNLYDNPIVTATGVTTLFAVLVNRSNPGPTFASANQLKIKLLLAKD